MELRISKHAERRIRSRVGIPKRSVRKEVERAFYSGVTYSQSKGQLRKYFTKIWRKTRDKPLIRVYNHFAWVFVKVKGGAYVLKTTYNIPSTLYKLEDAIRNQQTQENEEEGQ